MPFAFSLCREPEIAVVTTPQVLDLVRKFYELKQPFRFALFEGAGHGVREFKIEKEGKIENFFNVYQRDSKKCPGLELH